MKQPTIRDVALAAGVSTATVSKFVNGTKRFSSDVEAKIEAVIASLGYVSNPLARSMITGRTNTVGLAVLDSSNPHFASIIKGASRAAQEHGYTVLLVDFDETPSRERPILDVLSRRVDGMLLYSRMTDNGLDWLRELGKPVVLFGRCADGSLPTVSADDQLGARMLASRLVQTGHRRISYLGFSKSRRDDERKEGLRGVLEERGVPLALHDASAPTAAEGGRLAMSVLFDSERPDAVVCYNDLMAIGFMKEARDLGFRVPEDVSIAGFDNIEFGCYTVPPLTSVDLLSEQQGEAGVEKLLAIIAGTQDASRTVLPPRLVLRSSVAHRNPRS